MAINSRGDIFIAEVGAGRRVLTFRRARKRGQPGPLACVLDAGR
jgi:hypothetical protein